MTAMIASIVLAWLALGFLIIAFEIHDLTHQPGFKAWASTATISLTLGPIIVVGIITIGVCKSVFHHTLKD